MEGTLEVEVLEVLVIGSITAEVGLVNVSVDVDTIVLLVAAEVRMEDVFPLAEKVVAFPAASVYVPRSP